MSFQTFDVTELDEDADDDYAIEFTTGESRLGLMVTETELEALAESFKDTVQGETDRFDGKSVHDIAAED